MKRKAYIIFIVTIAIFLISIFLNKGLNYYNSINRSWGASINEDGSHVYYNGSLYGVTPAQTKAMGETVGFKGGWNELRITIHTIPGLDDNQWLAVRDQGSAQSFIYEVVGK